MAGTRVKAKRVRASGQPAGANGAASSDSWAPPRRRPEELDDLARAQGLPLITDIDAIAGDFWPEDETCDEFIAAYRSWRQAGRQRP